MVEEDCYRMRKWEAGKRDLRNLVGKRTEKRLIIGANSRVKGFLLFKSLRGLDMPLGREARWQ